jgi:RND family efflux transporter MFP subunit
MKRIILISLAVLVLLVLTIGKLFSNASAAKKKIYIHDMNAKVLVQTANPQIHTFESAFSYLGTFEAMHQNNVAAEGSGKLVDLYVKEGDRVAKGQVLAKLDDELILLQIETAKLNIAQLKNDNARFTNLRKEQAVSSVDAEKIELALKTAEVQLKQLQKQLRSTQVLAPFSGVVTKKISDLGSMVMPGTPIVELTDISQLKLNISVPERDVFKLKKGQDVAVDIDAQGQRVSGTIYSISVQADALHNFKVQVLVKNNTSAPIFSGMYGTVILDNSQKLSALSVPRKALIGSTKKPQIYVVRNGKAYLTAFSPGTSDGNYIEVVSGLSKNDEIVVKGQVNLEDKMNIKRNK